VKEEREQPRRDLPERTFEFARRVVKLCQTLDQVLGVSRTLANQLLRSGTSIGANVEEGQAGQSRADFLSKLSIACKEARETHYWLRLLAATELVPESRLTELLDEANQLVAILTAIIRKTKERRE
jgi:four helix bundle protein